MNRIEEPEAEVSRLKSVVEWQRATIEQRDERIAELEEALRPFARVCDIIPVDDGDAAVQTVVYGTISLSAGQFRAARAVFQGVAPKSPEEIESSVRQMLADPAIKRDVREFAKTISPTAEDLSRRIGAAPKEERCHVWGGDVSRWELPEFAPTGNAGDPGARMKCCASCRWMSLSWADRILLGRRAAICTHPKTGRQDPVSGQIIGQGARCSLVRQGRIDGDSCGPEGRWWEATE